MIPLARRLSITRGDEPADLVFRNAQIVNVLSGEIHAGDVVIAGGYIVTLGAGCHAADERDLSGRYVVPGLIDGHMHLESTMMTMGQFARAVVPRGTTTVVVDPHEFANVLGLDGVQYVMESAAGLPLDAFVMLSSSVPASPLESPRRALRAADLVPLLDDKRVLGLAEVMDIAGVLRGDLEVLAKIEAARARHLRVDGHAPAVRGQDLHVYAAAGIESDHESTTAEEAREKLRNGLWLMVREGSAARNLEALLPLLEELRPARAMFVTDDVDPVDLMTRGHVDAMVRMALDYGIDPVEAIRLASHNAAHYFGLDDRGAVAPGYRADLLIVDDLPRFAIAEVYKEGTQVARHGAPLFKVPAPSIRELSGLSGTVNVAPLTIEQLRIPGSSGPATVIGIEPGQITTCGLVETVVATDGTIMVDPPRDLLKLVAVERHHASGRVGLGLVRGFGLRRGAMASSVAHDAHNLVAVGADDADILSAIDIVRRMGGGFAVVAGDHVTTVPLPLGGLISAEPAELLASKLAELDRAAAGLGCRLENPFMTLSFLSLSVIPELRVTDRGLVDVAAGEIIPIQS